MDCSYFGGSGASNSLARFNNAAASLVNMPPFSPIIVSSGPFTEMCMHFSVVVASILFLNLFFTIFIFEKPRSTMAVFSGKTKLTLASLNTSENASFNPSSTRSDHLFLILSTWRSGFVKVKSRFYSNARSKFFLRFATLQHAKAPNFFCVLRTQTPDIFCVLPIFFCVAFYLIRKWFADGETLATAANFACVFY